MPYKLADREKRNEELVVLAKNRLDLTWKQIGQLFGISGARAWWINKRWKER